MRRPLTLLALLATLVLVACGGDEGGSASTQQPAASTPTATTTAPAFAEISVQEADAKARGNAVLVDVREDDEWAAGHAPDADPRPARGILSDAKLAELDEQRGDGELIFICRSGNRSGQAAAAAQAAGLAGQSRAFPAAWATGWLPASRSSRPTARSSDRTSPAPAHMARRGLARVAGPCGSPPFRHSG